jgi:hypothetical protein
MENRVEEPSVKSLFIKMYFNDQILSTATGFIANSKHGPVLVTNRHNVTGKNNDTDKCLSPTGGIPNKVEIMHNSLRLGEWTPKIEMLYDGNDPGNSKPLWKEHPILKGKMDCIALPLTDINDIQLLPYDVENPGKDIDVGPSDTVSVIGFPFNIKVGGFFAVWSTGFVASEPNIDFNDLPIFLIDCRSRPGQSGSPVIVLRRGGTYTNQKGDIIMCNGPIKRLLGIYSGRINSESDLGIVWKMSAIKELVNYEPINLQQSYRQNHNYFAQDFKN